MHKCIILAHMALSILKCFLSNLHLGLGPNKDILPLRSFLKHRFELKVPYVSLYPCLPVCLPTTSTLSSKLWGSLPSAKSLKVFVLHPICLAKHSPFLFHGSYLAKYGLYINKIQIYIFFLTTSMSSKHKFTEYLILLLRYFIGISGL